MKRSCYACDCSFGYEEFQALSGDGCPLDAYPMDCIIFFFVE